MCGSAWRQVQVYNCACRMNLDVSSIWTSAYALKQCEARLCSPIGTLCLPSVPTGVEGKARHPRLNQLLISIEPAHV